MQLKGLVRFFAGALILISVYYLSFTFLVRSYESKVDLQAKTDVLKMKDAPEVKYKDDKEARAFYQDTLNDLIKARRQRILDSTSNQQIAGFPWYVTYTKAKERELNLGLDLQGGMNVVLDVSVQDVILSLSGHSTDKDFNRALENAAIAKKASQSDFVTLFGQEYAKVAPQGRLATIFANAYQKDINFNTSNDEVLKVIRREAGAAIKNTYLVLQKRIDKFGVASPNISLDESKGIISVELAGVDNPDRVRKYLQASANLEFRETYRNDADFVNNVLVKMNEALKNATAGKPVVDTAATAATKPAAAATDSSKDGSLAAFIGDSAGKKKGGKVDSAKLMADAEKEFLKTNPLFAILHPQITQDGQPLPSAVVGRIMPTDTAAFKAYLTLQAVKNVMPKDLVFAFGPENKQDKHGPLEVFALKINPANPAPRVSGERVVDAKQDYDQNGNAEISMAMDNVGAREWKKLTGELAPKGGADESRANLNYVAVVLDSIVYTAPSIINEIPGGHSQITGSFTVEEAKDLANILKSGKMPAPAKIVQEQIVGPTLGAESIAAGAKSFIISFIVIFVLMLVYYNTAGIVANIALILNLLFTFGILASLGATLTMPGIAGLVLTVGMAVDTNVIIFERIKDELVHGRTYPQAIEFGYRRSYAPVLDGHITSLLTAIILFYFGLGPVLGFATTQIIGLLLSLFCGIMISRIVTDYYTNKKRHFEYFTPISRKIFKHAAFDFVGKRKYAYVISGFMILLGASSFFHGFRHGVDFDGGRSFTIRFDQPMKTEEVRTILEKEFNSEPYVKTIGNTNQLNITTNYRINEQNPEVDREVTEKLYNGLKKFYDKSLTYESFSSPRYIVASQTVSPTISDDLRAGAVKATILSLVVIFLYILLRFNKWQYSIGTIFSLLHDVMVTLAVFSYCRDIVPFPLEVDQHFIAAILTVIGFSMNDTVIVFDRIREYFRGGQMKGMSRDGIINKAINDTLSRTVMTSLTVFLTILILFIFGGEVTRGFAFAMLIGVITGTYSSIFVAAPVLVDFDKKNELANESEAVPVKDTDKKGLADAVKK
ncbi:protein translocase subunit SecDF [Chitinophaga sancti]|uniref:Multifunctional fusion protein n=1 Tax=Chitinophaga sancti TaxID=1004 RepID=A0A1K1LUC9_9BACT|nr:protein translocase subunit SecDF [Chitinophaga sancti]WQD64846.1 protein translocase subunit SecDF [Chitinophaga sancti]WQG89530.1 protein translocase subunit SecDF [Chitinophaga sancti]SFW14459.1 SecD/SecF fusion protein [Chitinophaga sancti]